MNGALYRVTGRAAFRGHPHGETFEAVLPRPQELRAVARGDIEVLERIIPSIRPGSYTLPAGWLQPTLGATWQK